MRNFPSNKTLTGAAILLLSAGSAVPKVVSGDAWPHTASKGRIMPTKHKTVVTDEIRLVDESGKTRLLLSVRSGEPAMEFLRPDGSASLTASLDSQGHGALRLQNPDGKGPVAAIEIDDKGAHVKFDRPGKASSYLFLNNEGASGVVLIDTRGERRLSVIVDPDGKAKIQQFDGDQPKSSDGE